MRFLTGFLGAGFLATWALASCGGEGSGGSSTAAGADKNGGLGSGANDGGNVLGGANPVIPVSTGSGGNGSGGDCNPKVRGVLRDFQPFSVKKNVPSGVTVGANPDFQNDSFDGPAQPELGIVQALLGTDKKPVYAGGSPPGSSKTTHGASPFGEWFKDQAGVNKSVVYELHLVAGSQGNRIFDSADAAYGGSEDGFFPLDGFPDTETFAKDGIGDDKKPHKFSFTFEIHMEFKYNGGELFRFTGDDDVWVFVNNNLAIDLGGVHGPGLKNGGEGTIDFDKDAAKLGIEKGQTYAFDVFQAERHTTGSNFRIETSLGFTNCQDIILR